MLVRNDLQGVFLPAVGRDGADDIQTFDQFVPGDSPTENVPDEGAGPDDGGYISPDALVASTVQAVLAQRLIRRLCPMSRRAVDGRDAELPNDLVVPPGHTIYEAVGCRECHQSGNSGRIPIFELLPMNLQLRALCNREASAAEIQAVALSEGMQTLLGIENARAYARGLERSPGTQGADSLPTETDPAGSENAE